MSGWLGTATLEDRIGMVCCELKRLGSKESGVEKTEAEMAGELGNVLGVTKSALGVGCAGEDLMTLRIGRGAWRMGEGCGMLVLRC